MNMDIIGSPKVTNSPKATKRDRGHLTETTPNEPATKKTDLDLGLDLAAPRASNPAMEEVETEFDVNPGAMEEVETEFDVNPGAMDDVSAPIENATSLVQTPNVLVDTDNVFVTPMIAAPQKKLDYKIISPVPKSIYLSLAPSYQAERNAEICERTRYFISQTFTIPDYVNKYKKDTSLFELILSSIPHDDMDLTTFHAIVKNCFIPNNLYKEHLKELGNNDEKRGFMDDFNKYIKLLKDPNTKSSAFDPNEESQVDYLAFTPDKIISEDKNIESFHPGSSLIYKGTSLNYGMTSLFTSRIKLFFGDVSFNALTLSIFELFSSKKEPDFDIQLKDAYMTNLFLYNIIKFYIDAGDLIHDVNKIRIDNLEKNNYYTGLLTIGNMLKTNLSQLGPPNVEEEIKKCFTAGSVGMGQDIIVRKVSQEKTRKMRSDALDLIFQTSSTVNTLMPKLETIELTQEIGCFELIKQINIIYGNSPVGKFIYRESGRKLQIAGIVDYYNTLNDETRLLFIKKCVDYCDNAEVNADYIHKLISIPSSATSPLPPDLQVDLKSITSFDGCGTTKGLLHDKINIATFQYVFGFFKYVVYTVFDATQHKFNHLVIVTSYAEPLKPLAVFGFVGNITINMLLGVSKIPQTREGSGEKGDLKSISEICSILMKDASWNSTVIDHKGDSPWPTNWVVPTDNALTMYYDSSIEEKSGVRQLLFLGNKTIGDLIVTTYDDVKTVTTVDSLIADSTMYNFLAGKSKVLQSVWRQTASKGWVFTPGMFAANLTTKSNYIVIQMLGSLMLLQVVLTPGKSNDLNPIWQSLVITYYNIIQSICKTGALQKTRILTRFRVLLNYTFVDFSNHITNSYVDKPSVYNECMLQLLIIENKVIQTRVKNYINTLATYIKTRASLANTDDANILFLNQIYLLPKLETLFFSNISNIASNNQEAYDLPGLTSMLVPENNITISSITTSSIVFEYNSKSKFKDQSYFTKNLITSKEITLADPTKIPGAEWRDPTRTYAFTIPYTIESLIQLLETGKIKDPDAQIASVLGNLPSVKNVSKLDVQNRIISFFKNNISALGISDTNRELQIDAATTFTKIIETLTTANILSEGQQLQDIENVVLEEDDAADCPECTTGVCLVDDTPVYSDKPPPMEETVPTVPTEAMELGGNKKTTRKKRKTKQKRKTKGGKKPGKNKTKKQRKNKNKKNTTTRRRK